MGNWQNSGLLGNFSWTVLHVTRPGRLLHVGEDNLKDNVMEFNL